MMPALRMFFGRGAASAACGGVVVLATTFFGGDLRAVVARGDAALTLGLFMPLSRPA